MYGYGHGSFGGAVQSLTVRGLLRMQRHAVADVTRCPSSMACRTRHPYCKLKRLQHLAMASEDVKQRHDMVVAQRSQHLHLPQRREAHLSLELVQTICHERFVICMVLSAAHDPCHTTAAPARRCRGP